jgi:DNA-binding PadR family transcriptional regulator
MFFRQRHDHRGFGGRPGHHWGGRGGGLFGRFGGGPGMRAARMLASGDLQLVIISLLAEKPRHGYEIIKALEEHSKGVYTPSPGMVYPALTYLEEMGYAASETEGSKKLFRITDAGKEYLEKNKKSVDETLAELARFGERMAKMREHFAEEQAEEESWGNRPHDEAKKEWHQIKAEFHDLKHDLKAALFEKLQAPLEEKKRVLEVLKRAIQEIRNK